MGDADRTPIPPHHVSELTGFFAAHDQWLFGHACVRTQGDRELAGKIVELGARIAAGRDAEETLTAGGALTADDQADLGRVAD